MRLSATIMAHPVREDSAERVRAALDRDVEIIYDTEAEPSKDPRQRWRTGRRAWEAHDPEADYHLVLQDDALISRDLITGLEKALDVLGPEGLVSAYTGTGRPNQTHVRRALSRATDRDDAWMTTRSLCWGVAILTPVHTIGDMLRWCSHGSKSRMPYDMRIGRYYRDRLRWRTWYTVPSLVEHQDGESLCGNGRGSSRVAHQFLGEDASALTVDWTRTPPSGLPTLHTVPA
ncbi:hypothetical protein [Nocardiopsis salina]|uniref:hypothetical protein n=1 Tax=Nocardiopsis salina TaxID=245836 RepID=UPI000346F178|nr:hypothetical protein [Nocardiopsis salina]